MVDHAPGRQRSLLYLLLTLAVGFALSCGLTYLLPGFMIFGAALACCFLLYAIYKVYSITHRGWATWATVAAIVLFGVGALLLSENLGTVRGAEPTDVVVVKEKFETKEEGRDRTHGRKHNSYKNVYELEKTDGTPIEEPLVFFGEAGYEGVHEGHTATVLIDSDGTPLRPVGSLHIDLGKDLTLFGLIAVLGTFGMCSLLLVRDMNSARSAHQV
jgi:hypothetical protein